MDCPEVRREQTNVNCPPLVPTENILVAAMGTHSDTFVAQLGTEGAHVLVGQQLGGGHHRDLSPRGDSQGGRAHGHGHDRSQGIHCMVGIADRQPVAVSHSGYDSEAGLIIRGRVGTDAVEYRGPVSRQTVDEGIYVRFTAHPRRQQNRLVLRNDVVDESIVISFT